MNQLIYILAYVPSLFFCIIKSNLNNIIYTFSNYINKFYQLVVNPLFCQVESINSGKHNYFITLMHSLFKILENGFYQKCCLLLPNHIKPSKCLPLALVFFLFLRQRFLVFYSALKTSIRNLPFTFFLFLEKLM